MYVLYEINEFLQMPNSLLFFIIEDTKDITIFVNEEHDGVQFIMDGSNRSLSQSV